ncbi:uncharacterized protein [Panulirus ornatus]|uniref:uncharacterized protein isoform X2 n=1 Tax=Panulirus ornatus TaxID=150431 RepID=UPI003A8A7100
MMKVAIPGRAIKMQEHYESGATQMNPLLKHGKIPFNNIEIRPTIDYLKLNSPPQGANSLVDGAHLNNRDWNRTAKLYKKELKAKGNIRPSTAVRQHVKKISEEFTMTQTKYENAVNTSGGGGGGGTASSKNADGKDKLPPNSAPSSTASLTTKVPQSKLGKNGFAKITCSKCESITKASRKNVMAPLVTSAGSSAGRDATAAAAAPMTPLSKSHSAKNLSKTKHSCLASRDSSSPQKKFSGSASLSPPGSSPRPRHRHPNGRCGAAAAAVPGALDLGLAPTSPAMPRSPGRKTSSSSLGGVSPRSKQMSFEQIKKVKMFTERAILEGRVFSIFGYFPAIKDALRRRGWVEKIQHTVPYVNPHPNNCVCPHVGYQATTLPLPTTANSGSSAPSGRNGMTSAPAASNRASSDQDEGGGEDTAPAATDEGTAAASDTSALPHSTSSNSSSPLSSDKSPSPASSSSSPSSQSDGEQQKAITASTGSSSVENVASPQDKTSVDTSPNDAPASDTDAVPSSHWGSEEAGKSSSIPEESGDSNPNDLSDNCDRLNTAILGPSEIRKGIAQAITEKNATIFRYSTIHIPKKKATNDAEGAGNEEPTDEKCEEEKENDDEDEGETVADAPEEEAKASPEPYNPYIDYELCDMDLPLVARLLRNVEPNFLWTWTRDSISFKHLSREQVVNRFPNTPFTTKVPMKRVRQALTHVEQFIQSCCHDDLDSPPPAGLRDHEWDALLAAHYKIVHMDKKVKVATPAQLQALVADCESAVQRVVPHWPQLAMDGLRNLWIVKPGAQSRGRGIFMMNHLEEILALVQSPLIYETKYVVQKYMERPMLIHNTKFDIRQWFLVTDWNPLHVWVYKECYLRFCSQQYDLTNNNEAVHLSNNAIQCKYLNGERSGELPEENMWDCDQFKDYLRGLKKERMWEEVIYPGMRDALVAAMLAAQVEMDTFKHGFELFGADFMLTEDLKPWLIEINSSPCMAPTTSVTRRMCAHCLQDVIKVVVDYKHNKTADTGLFELAYRDNERSVPNPPYLGVNLQVVGRQIRRGPIKPEKKRTKKARPAVRLVKPLPLITLSLEDGAHNPARDTTDVLARNCSLLDCRRYASGSTASLPLSTTTESSEGTENESNKLRSITSSRVEGAGEGHRQDFPELGTPVGGDCSRSNTRDGAGGGRGGGGNKAESSSVSTTNLDCRGS